MGLQPGPNTERSDFPLFRRFILSFPAYGRLPIAVLFGLLAPYAICRAQESTAQHLEVYWHHDRTLAIAGITSVVVFDESVCRAEFLGDKLRLIGSARGQTEVFVWAGEHLQTLLVDVVEEPEKPVPPSLRALTDGNTTATLGTSMRSASGSGQPGGYTFFHRLWWQENIGEDHLTIQTQWLNATVPGNPAFNLNSGSIQYSTPSATLAFLDTNVNLGGGNQARITPYPIATSMMVRGVDLQLTRNGQQIEIFGGITPTPYFLNFTGARGIAGVTWTHVLNPKLSVYSTTAATYVPSYGIQSERKYLLSAFGLAGGTFAVNERLKLQAGAGLSTKGPILDGAFLYVNPRLTAFANATYSSLNFPLNQLRLLPSGQTSGTAGLTSRVTARVSASLLYQHSSTQAGTLLTTGSSSDYWNTNISFLFKPNLHLTGNYVLNSTRGALSLAPRSISNRADLELSSQISRQLNDSVRTAFGTLSDPFQYNSQDSFSLANSDNLRVGSRGTLSFNASYDRTSAGLLSRLREDIYLLAPELQVLFLQDPVAFVRSPNMPNDLRTLLLSWQPSNTQFSASGQFLIGNRISFSPTAGYFRSTQDLHGHNNSQLFGVNLAVQMTSSLQLISSLSNVITLNPSMGNPQRTTVFDIGVNKTLNTRPHWLADHAGKNRAISGRVFQDLNVNGICDPGEPGVQGVAIQIDDEPPVLADSRGRFSFRSLKPGVYVIRLSLASIRGPFRVTTPAMATLDLTRLRSGQVNFGIVNFARIEGTVYNDYLLNGQRQPDAPGIRHVRVILIADTFRKETVTDSAGEFGFDRLNPGDYQLTIKPSTIPANFEVPHPVTVHITPAQISTQELPLRALRSLAGHVLYKPKSEAPEQPLAGVQVSVGDKAVYTDETGAFLLRNLPAGKLVLSLVPYRPLGPGLAAPSGTIELARDPVEGQDIRIVLTNAELVKHLTPKISASERHY